MPHLLFHHLNLTLQFSKFECLSCLNRLNFLTNQFNYSWINSLKCFYYFRLAKVNFGPLTFGRLIRWLYVFYFEGSVISPSLRSYCLQLCAVLQATSALFSGTFSGQDTGQQTGHIDLLSVQVEYLLPPCWSWGLKDPDISTQFHSPTKLHYKPLCHVWIIIEKNISIKNTRLTFLLM